MDLNNKINLDVYNDRFSTKAAIQAFDIEFTESTLLHLLNTGMVYTWNHHRIYSERLH